MTHLLIPVPTRQHTYCYYTELTGNLHRAQPRKKSAIAMRHSQAYRCDSVLAWMRTTLRVTEKSFRIHKILTILLGGSGMREGGGRDIYVYVCMRIDCLK